MLLKKPNQQQQKQAAEQVKGIYMPKEKRIEARNEIARAHFQFGSKEERQGNHFYKDTIAASSYNQIPSASLGTQKLNQEVKNDLRKAHFLFGNDRVQYETTNKRTYLGNNQDEKTGKGSFVGEKEKQIQNERMQKMRTQNFTYGQDVPQYQSMAKKDFQAHNTKDAVKNLQVSKENGKELRKSHFMLGSDEAPYTVKNQGNQVTNFNQIKSQIVGSSAALRKNNFQLEQACQGGADFFTYETVTGTQMAAIRGGIHDIKAKKAQADQMTALKQDLRQAHFHMGTNQPNYISSQKETMTQHQLSNSGFKEAQELGKKMQHANFEIGVGKNQNLKNAQTSYQQTISGTVSQKNGNKVESVQLGLRNSNFRIGTGTTVSYVSEAKDKFINLEAQKGKPGLSEEMSKNLKGHHFTLAEHTKPGEQPKNYFGTVHKQQYNYKGDASLIRGHMANEVKADLRASHFQVGFDQNGPFRNSSFNSRPVSAVISRQQNTHQMQQNPYSGSLTSNPSQNLIRPQSSIPTSHNQNSANKNSGLAAAEINKASNVFQASAKDKNFSDYKTSNQQFYKWIQPAIK
eukprot:403365079